ncbi:MAG: CBS domain-containing protein [Proteobacteria bacterium]|nr:CBS domain-containing protein [Pseudomonadota bacterium]MBU1641427.1 CBS domain-containing protein [Pseudomonadota bacterium]
MDVITSHLNADFDCMASMLAARKLYPDAKLVFPGSQERNLRRFLNESGLTFEFTRLRSLDLDAIDRLIVVDNRQASRIGPFNRCLKNPDLKLHIFDHHPATPDNMKGSHEVIRQVGSTATLFIQLFQEQQISITGQEATTLAMAIYEDTGNFTFASTTPADLIAMAWLLEQGANIDMVTQYINKELTRDEVSLLNELIKSATTYTINTVPITIARIILPDYFDEFALLVRRFMAMENLDTLFALAAMDDRVYIIGRSRVPEVNVGLITMAFGGGGHASAASASLKDHSLVQVEEKLLKVLHNTVQPKSLAGELMSSPVISVAPTVAISAANRTLIRYNITVLPVVKEGEILGLLTRREAAKAIYHDLGDEPVASYMTTEFEVVSPEATILDIQRLIITNRQRTIPVVHNGELVGIITRTDLFTLLAGNPAFLPELKNNQTLPSVERHRNLTNQLRHTLTREALVLLQTIGEIAVGCGATAYVVGGFVRDLLLGVANLDLDIVIEGDGIDFAKKLAAHCQGKIRTHEKFNTAVVVLPNGLKIDIATARLEYYEHPAAMPKVESSSIKLDLYRRDFTINAMAIHLNPDRFGTLVDFFNSQNDLKDRMIRILHNLSFVEDPTRIFRAIRFEQRMGFSLGKHTEKQIKNSVRLGLFDADMGQRFFQELKLILAEKDPLPAIRRLDHFGLLPFLHPRLKTSIRSRKILRETEHAVSWYKLLYLDTKIYLWIVYFLALTARMKTKHLGEMCKKLEIPERFSQIIISERVAADRAARHLDKADNLRPSQIYKVLKDLRHEGLLFAMANCRNKSGQMAISSFVTRLSHITIQLQGDDLIALGYQPGPLFQTILNRLLMATLDGVCKNREDEIALLKKEFPLPVKS